MYNFVWNAKYNYSSCKSNQMRTEESWTGKASTFKHKVLQLFANTFFCWDISLSLRKRGMFVRTCAYKNIHSGEPSSLFADFQSRLSELRQTGESGSETLLEKWKIKTAPNCYHITQKTSLMLCDLCVPELSFSSKSQHSFSSILLIILVSHVVFLTKFSLLLSQDLCLLLESVHSKGQK